MTILLQVFPSMSVSVTVTLVGCLGLIAYIATNVLRRKRLPTEPPYVQGHSLWGNAKEFNANAVNFLHQCEKEHGDVFTIRLVHQYMTIVADPHSVKAFSKEPNFDFNPIQEQVNHNIFGFKIPESKKMLTAVGKTTKGTAIPKTLHGYQQLLNQAYSSLEESMAQRKDPVYTEGLRSFASKTIFHAIFNNIFGADKMSSDFNSQAFAENFYSFHQYFNHLWLGLPHALFPEAGEAMKKLMNQPGVEALLGSPETSDYLKVAAEFMHQHGKSDRDVKAHNLVYLHVNFNTFKVAFWCVYYLLSHQEALEALKEEIEELICEKAEDDGGAVPLTMADLDGMKILESVVNESFRLSSGVFMVRHVTQDTEFTTSSGKTVTIREGDKVAVYPPAFHKDPSVFEDPLTFKYDRFVDKTFYKNGEELRTPVLPFGSLCPGKKTALLQCKFFLVSMFNKFDMSLLPGETTTIDVRYHGHEIMPPVNDVQVSYSLKPVSRNLVLETKS